MSLALANTAKPGRFGKKSYNRFERRKIMSDRNNLILTALDRHIRVNTSNRTVEIYDEYGVKMRLANLSDETFKAFAEQFVKF